MKPIKILLLTLLAALSLGAVAQEATIRKNLAERLPNLPKIDEVSKTPMPGLYEVRVNQSEIFYTDEKGDFLIQGSLIDTQARVDLTEQRLDKLSAIAYKDLPIKDAFTIVRGNGKRKMAVFSDPNCGYCKRLERDLAKIDNVTVHLFLYPILSADSTEKSRNIWCSKDKGKAYLDWMVRDVTPATASCDASAMARNVEFGKKSRITGTPTVIFADGTRVPGAIDVARIEKFLTEAKP
ncbi:MAG: DsbC family protein [Hydrogenophaga sp.]|uniref:DsbC family protein n=1 Tax=Hydrogenophaga sp. TaxID=1904254 RepID=UPI0027167CE8|nr:DsbC family protein [Hydrogenophaga sp.]MDO9200745.1 DsbC family protein [Hydrogenophaga sp.]MDP1894438.1 DsbC family protein [Hydrogenophaga sp.]MDP3344215.1 DsbC family protein [Hydrogenophaga sp.]MDP3807407.1 DsbC family protein [Hydrogenophaga sp.]MDP3924320.1 DsbC family protein [Hydrogenophaga sp.]